MNLLLLYPDDFTETNTVTLTDRRFDHLKKIIKAVCGQTIDAGLLNGKSGTGIITEITSHHVTLVVELNEDAPSAAATTLILALPRPLMMKRILQTITTMGIKEIHLINSQRVEKSYWSSSDLASDVVHHQLILGLEQARDTVLPTVHLHKHFKTLLQNDLPRLVKNKRALLAHPGKYPPCPANVITPNVLAIGPEGGFIDQEVNQLISAGFEAVQLGARPLRVEAAVTALLGRLLPI